MMARRRRRGYCRTGRESRVGVMTDDDDAVASASGLSGSLSFCLASLSLCFTFSVRFTAEFFFFFIYLHGSWALASWAARLGLEFMIFGKGGLSKKLRGPSLYFFF